MQQTLTDIAKELGVDATSLQSLVEFFQRAIATKPELVAILTNGSDEEKQAAITAGVTAWHQRSIAFYNELLDGKTERAQAWRENIRQSLLNR